MSSKSIITKLFNEVKDLFMLGGVCAAGYRSAIPDTLDTALVSEFAISNGMITSALTLASFKMGLLLCDGTAAITKPSQETLNTSKAVMGFGGGMMAALLLTSHFYNTIDLYNRGMLEYREAERVQATQPPAPDH
jgi:hypothetical protein